MADIPEPLRTALTAQLAGIPGDALRASVERLIEVYRSGSPPSAPILASPTDVAAYAAYRMPATFAAVRAAIHDLDLGFDPESVLDLGGGTGAASWALAETFGSLRDVTVVDQSRPALDLGSRLAAGAPWPGLRGAAWDTGQAGGPLQAADLIMISYVLGELPQPAREDLVTRAASAGRAVVCVEPGTPAGYERIIAARTVLIGLGYVIVAPCPHQAPCPLPSGRDWCHFAARVNRSGLHRRLKDGDLSYEDEKFSYVVAVRPEAATHGADPDAQVGRDAEAGSEVGSGSRADSAARVIRRPAQRKGLVSLQLCRPDGTAGEQIVTKRHGDLYKIARDVSWGDQFPA